MYSKSRQIWIAFACILGLNLCFCFFGNSQTSVPQSGDISAEQLEKLSKAGSTLRIILNHFNILSKGSKNSYQLAKEIYEMLEEKLKLQVDKKEKNMEDLDLVSLMRLKRGSPRDTTLLFASFLETCEIPTAVVIDEGTWLLLFQTDANAPHIVQWNQQVWGVLTIPIDKWVKFADAQQQGRERYRQLEQDQMLQVIYVHSHWRWNFEETVETLIRQGIDHGQRGELQEAQKLFSNVLKIDPKNAAALNNLGNLDLFNEKIDAAIQKYNQALQIDQNDSAIYLNLGVARYQKWKRDTDKKQKQVLEKQYQDAFDAAYRGVLSGLNLCRYLGINLENEADAEYCWLIYDAERRVTTKEPQWRPIGGRGKQPEFPVYWKNF